MNNSNEKQKRIKITNKQKQHRSPTVIAKDQKLDESMVSTLKWTSG